MVAFLPTVKVSRTSEITLSFDTRTEALLAQTGSSKFIQIGELRYTYDASGTALITGDGRTWSPAGECSLKHFGGAVDGTTDDSAAVSAWLAHLVSSETEGVIDGYARLGSLVTVNMDGSAPGDQIAIRGIGMAISGFLVDNDTGGILFQGTGVGRKHSVQMSDLHFKPAKAQSGYPFKITGTAGGLGNDSAAIINDVFVGETDEDSTNDFSDGPAVTGLFRPVFRNLRVVQAVLSSGSKWNNAVDVSNCYKPEFWGCYINVTAVGATYGIKHEGTDQEGFLAVGTTVNGADYGVWQDMGGDEPELQIIGGHINANIRCVYANGVKFFRLDGALLYTNGATAGAACHIELVNASGGIINADYRTLGEDDERFIKLNPGGSDAVDSILIDAHGFYGATNSGAAPIYVAANATNIEIHAPESARTVDFTSIPSNLVEVANASSSTVVLIKGLARTFWDDGSVGAQSVDEVISASPASNDELWRHNYRGRNSAGEATDYARVRSFILSPTDALEEGRIDIDTMYEGSMTPMVQFFRGALNGHTSMVLASRESGVHVLYRVKVGANDSGGTGLRALTINNV